MIKILFDSRQSSVAGSFYKAHFLSCIAKSSLNAKKTQKNCYHRKLLFQVFVLNLKGSFYQYYVFLFVETIARLEYKNSWNTSG